MSLVPSSIISFETFRSQGRDWKRFGGRIFILIGVPLILFIGLLEFICWRTGENMSTRSAALLQKQNPHLIFMRIQDANQVAFKAVRVSQERPEILAMGQSRAAQFRSGMFRPYSFYNYARLAWTFKGYADLLRQLPADYHPKVIIFNLDFYMFTPSNTSVYSYSDQQAHLSALENHVDALRDVLTLFYTHPWLVAAGRHSAYDGGPSVGINPALFGHGFRYDGSETQSIKSFQSAGEDLHLLSTFQPGGDPLFFGDKMGAQEMTDFEDFVKLAHARCAVLIGIQMPFYGPVLHAIEQDPRYDVLKDYRAHVASGYFDHLGVIALDESALPPYSDDYHYFIDRLHSTEAVSAAVVLKMSEEPRTRAALSRLDVAGLKRMLEQDKKASQHIYLYNYQF